MFVFRIRITLTQSQFGSHLVWRWSAWRSSSSCTSTTLIWLLWWLTKWSRLLLCLEWECSWRLTPLNRQVETARPVKSFITLSLVFFFKMDLFRLCPPPPSLVGAYYLPPPPEPRAIFLHSDLLCNGTCSAIGGSITYGGGQTEKIQKKSLD